MFTYNDNHNKVFNCFFNFTLNYINQFTLNEFWSRTARIVMKNNGTYFHLICKKSYCWKDNQRNTNVIRKYTHYNNNIAQRKETMKGQNKNIKYNFQFTKNNNGVDACFIFLHLK